MCASRPRRVAGRELALRQRASEREVMAVRIQTRCRTRLVQRRQKALAEAATTIQTRFRGLRSRLSAGKKKDAQVSGNLPLFQTKQNKMFCSNRSR
eukprot:SAG11_NODE_12734_length_688_cov_0.803056_1_plen_96_part_00